MYPITSVLRRFAEEPRYMSLLALIVGLIVFYPATNYAFNPYFLWIVTFNPYDGKWYSFFINQNIIFQREFAVKVLVFTAILFVSMLASIKISQTLTKTILKESQEENSSVKIIQRWKAHKKIASTALILQYLALVALIGLTLLIWYNMLQQYATIFLTLTRITIIVVSALGILHLIHPLLDNEELLSQACLNIINSIKEEYPKEDIKKIEQAHFMLYILLNHTLSKTIEELEEFNLEPPLTTLYLALLQNEKETLNRAKTITTNLLKAIKEKKTQGILKHLAEIHKKLEDTKELSKTMEITVHYPSLTLYTFNPSKKTTLIKALIPLITQIPLAILIFLGKWLYYVTF
ncbi:MAG: hypothetical protein KIH08_15390 [Candidatus Freyarchaeota archaeon]|nr:hypothetical protein [Candidatus Jordarchaeia archaeon]MBS7270573.1 hypothetical protein [Candidatus Jordarchaeia archaeon]